MRGHRGGEQWGDEDAMQPRRGATRTRTTSGLLVVSPSSHRSLVFVVCCPVTMMARLLLLVAASVLALSCVCAVSAGAGPNRVQSLPGLSGAIDEMYTGYLSTNDGFGSQLFYWLAKARKPATPAANTPVVLWLQGGPGCSGGLGWFYENGPYNLNIDQTLSVNPYSWSENAHFLFIDQPIGTGLSTQPNNASYCTTIEQSTKQLYTAVQGFFQTFPDIAQNPFFITGESYGGKYIPNLATAILDGQSAFPINLKGLAIGDGWVAPLTQTSVYGAQAFNLGLIDENELANVNAQMDNCTALVNRKDWVDAQVVCDNLLNYIITTAGNINEDDVREWGDDEHDNRLEVYLSNPAVATALSLVAPPLQYESCSNGVGVAFATDEMIPSVQLLPRLIQSLQSVFLYEGIFDMNCGVVGVEKYLQQLYPSEVAAAQRQIWYSPDDNAVSGYVKSILPTLTFIVVQDAGHMVPKTQPKHSLDMITHLLTNTPFPNTRRQHARAATHIDAARNNAAKHKVAAFGAVHRRGRMPRLHHAQPKTVL